MSRLIQFIKERRFKMRLKHAIREADDLQELTGKHYLVLRWKDGIVVRSKAQLKYAIKRHALTCSIQQLESMALYETQR